MPERRCVIVPALKKHAVIPDQLVKKLNGITLIQRAIDTATALVPARDVHVVTDSEEIAVIAERNGVNALCKPELRFESADLLKELRFFILKRSREYETIILYRASTPLVDAARIEQACARFAKSNADIMVTVRPVDHRIWTGRGDGLSAMVFDEQRERLYVESRAFILLRSSAMSKKGRATVVSEELDPEEAVEIGSHQDWWILEKLLARKHIVFVVAGHPAIGMGHIQRALTVAHEIHDHRITFLCTKESALAARNIAARDQRTVMQQSDLLRDVLALEPDLVINDLLRTVPTYIKALKKAGVRVVNFEDTGPGARLADLTINELYDEPLWKGGNTLWGARHLFLRDEFEGATPRPYARRVRSALITFGGTDPSDLTRTTLRSLLPYCEQHGIRLHVVTGAGYTHQAELDDFLREARSSLVERTSATGIMSRTMEQCDIAVSSNGRTVYELAQMHIPAVVIAQHAREATHRFASERHGFINLGVARSNDGDRILKAFSRLVEDHALRRRLHDRMEPVNMTKNKARVVRTILDLLAT